MRLMVDISSHQKSFNPAGLKRQGFEALIHKASEGRGWTDAYMVQNLLKARDEGLVIGAYHFLREGSGAAQAASFHRKIQSIGGPKGMICVCDNEADASWADTRAFFAEWEQLSGGHPLVMYTGGWWWGPRGWNGASLTPYLWHSHYVSGSGSALELAQRVPGSWWSPGYGGWKRASFLQFTSSASVAGRSPIDVSLIDCDLSDIPRVSAEDDMAQLTGPDPFDGTRSQAGYLRDGYFSLVAGYRPPGDDNPNGVVARLERIEADLVDLKKRPGGLVPTAAEIAGEIIKQLSGG